MVAAFTFLLPERGTAQVRRAPDLGRAAWVWTPSSLLKNPDHRVVFLTVALFAIPLSAFYPYTPPHLRELGLDRTSAWMSLGQITEIIAMVSLGGAAAALAVEVDFRLRPRASGVLRFALCALGGKAWLLAGVILHGCSFTLVFITAQIYLDERVDPAWRARGQALMSLMGSGVGQFIGYLGAGWWFQACGSPAGGAVARFWTGVSAGCGAVLLYFLIAYHGIGSRPRPGQEGGKPRGRPADRRGRVSWAGRVGTFWGWLEAAGS